MYEMTTPSKSFRGDDPRAKPGRVGGWAVRGTPVAVVVAAVLLFLFGGKAQAQWNNICGTPTTGEVITCDSSTHDFSEGIIYWNYGTDPPNSWDSITLKIPGVSESTTQIATRDDNNPNLDSGVILLERRSITLEIGTGGRVAITQRGTRPSSYYNTATNSGYGIIVGVDTLAPNEAAIKVDVRSGVMIGTQAARMLQDGIRVTTWNTANTADHSISSGATIYARGEGIQIGSGGSGKMELTNTGDVTAGKRGLFLAHAGEVALTNSGAIVSGSDTATEAHGIHVYKAGTDPVMLKNSGAITAKGSGTHGIFLNARWAESGETEVTNSGAITAARGGMYVDQGGTGAVTVTNSGVIAAKQFGISILSRGSGNTRIINSGDITVDGDFTEGSTDSSGITVGGYGTGHLMIRNSGDITAENFGIFARNQGTRGDVTVRHVAGDIFGKGNSGIHASVGRYFSMEMDEDGPREYGEEGSESGPNPSSTASVRVDILGGSVKASDTSGRVGVEAINFEGGSVKVNVFRGATITAKNNAGIWAWLSDRHNADGRIRITQKGTITSGHKGVYALVDRSSAAGETRAAEKQPLIDIEWEGTFTQLERDAPNRLNNVAHAVEFRQERQGGEVIRGARVNAGIDAEVGSWRIVNRIVTGGDDPGASPDPNEVLAGDQGNAIVAAFRAALEDDRYEVPASDRGDIDTDGTTGYSDSELRTYLMNTPTVLQDVLRRGLSAQERAVLEALWTGGDVDAALAASDYTDEWQKRVRARRDSYNVGNIRVAVNGGSITSDGDGVRAWYALPHDRNGAIDVTVADGASVTGDVAGIYVANAGLGADGFAKQTVTVAGTVTGGTDAAVHLKRGGRITVEQTGQVNAGSSSRAVLSEAGHLDVTVAGTVMGDIRGMGAGDHAVTVRPGGMVTGTIHLDGSTVTNYGTIRGGDNGVTVGAGSTVTNSGTIEAKIPIQVGAGSTVTNSGTVRSTDGSDGVAIWFSKREDREGANTLTVRPGMTVVGKIKGLGGHPDDTVDLRSLADDEGGGGILFVGQDDTPINLDDIKILRSPRSRALCGGGGMCAPLDTTAFALADDVLSDLTGSIHGAVVERGMIPGRTDSGQPTVWATPFGGARNQNGAGTVADATHSFGGGMIGTSRSTSTLRVGGFLGGSVGMLDVDSRQDPDVDVQTIFGGLYTQWALGDGIYDARVLVGRMVHDSTRRIGNQTAEGESHSFFLSPEVGVATALKLASRVDVLPRLRVRYAGLFTKGFRESGKMTDWDVQFEKRTIHLLEGRAEVGVPFTLDNGGQINPRVGVEGRWLLSGSEIRGSEIRKRGRSFTIDAGGDDQVITGFVGVGVSVPVADAITLVGSFDGALTTEDAWRALGYMGLSYSF